MTNDLGANLLRYNYKDKTFNTFDTETESLNLRFSRPWNIAWIVSRGDQVIETQDRYLYWKDFNISKDAARITQFNLQEYKEKAEDPKKVFQEFEPVLYDKNITNIMHNGFGLDIFQIDSWRRNIGLKSDYSFINHCLDTHCLEKAIRLGLNPQYPLLAWQYKLNSVIKKGLKTNLTLLAKEYELGADESKFHAGLFDSEITRQLLLKQMWKLELVI